MSTQTLIYGRVFTGQWIHLNSKLTNPLEKLFGDIPSVNAMFKNRMLLPPMITLLPSAIEREKHEQQN